MKTNQYKSSHLIIFPLIVIVMVASFGCYDTEEYSGDGTLVNNGINAATDRYVLKLGMINIDKECSSSYRISNLPSLNFVFGFNIIYNGTEEFDFNPDIFNPLVSLQLEDSLGNIVFHKKSRLNSWTWSIPSNEKEAFVYGRGDPGTYFVPSPKSTYVLNYKTIEPFQRWKEYSIELFAKSGGWK